jgi:hypothetical protein
LDRDPSERICRRRGAGPGIDAPLDSDVFAPWPRDYRARGRSAATPTSDANEGARRFHQSIAGRSSLARRTPPRPHPNSPLSGRSTCAPTSPPIEQPGWEGSPQRPQGRPTREPPKGKLASRLNVPWNVQYLPKARNTSKSNRRPAPNVFAWFTPIEAQRSTRGSAGGVVTWGWLRGGLMRVLPPDPHCQDSKGVVQRGSTESR